MKTTSRRKASPSKRRAVKPIRSESILLGPRPLRRRAKAKRHSVLRLPTAAAFAALPLAKRTDLFARWLARQPKTKTYVYFDQSGCPLALFGQAIHRSKDARGGNDGFRASNRDFKALQVMTGFTPLSETLFYPVDGANAPCSGNAVRTFGGLSRAFNAALKAARLSAKADRETTGRT